MNEHSTAPEFLSALVRDLRQHLGFCESALALATEENRALTGADTYQPFDFHQKRKALLTGIDASLLRLRTWRQAWQQVDAADRERCAEVKPLFQKIQDLLMRVLLLDRENQQALLRRGLVPPNHLSLAAGPQPSHYVASVYRRNAAA
jgi:hypothetical protein